MRVLFAGSPAIAVPSLLALAGRHRIVGVLTNPESAQGRGKEVLPTAVALAAGESLGSEVPILAFERLGAEAREAVAALEPEILIAFAYGRIFGPKFLSIFPLGGVNIHPSLLPRHRGSSPIQQAILDGDRVTGVSIQRIALEMDSGELFAVEKVPLSGRETAGALSERCGEIGARLVVDVLEALELGEAEGKPQEGQPSYCGKISKEDGLIDWSAPAAEIDARIRAFDPWPGSHTYLNGQRLGVLEAGPLPAGETPTAAEAMLDRALPKAAAGTIIGIDKARGIVVRTGEGYLALKRLQFSARKALPYRDFANGMRALAGLRFENTP